MWLGTILMCLWDDNILMRGYVDERAFPAAPLPPQKKNKTKVVFAIATLIDAYTQAPFIQTYTSKPMLLCYSNNWPGTGNSCTHLLRKFATIRLGQV